LLITQSFTQDFGYWYAQGLLHPDLIVNAIIPIDQNTEENGCMRLMRRSHTLGRVDHGTFGGQAGADPDRVVAAMKLGGYEVVKLKLEPGDVAFMHSNTLHASAPNNSAVWRRNIITAYNSKENGPLPGSPVGQPQFNAIKVVPDTAIIDTSVSGVRGLDKANGFLS
jgi:ectoine hydroxylase-related dioxygenase (phytanoyl-CoA dioxygenase family)